MNLIAKQAGVLTIHVLDRDGYPVRKLVSQRLVKPEKYSCDWDGKDETGKIVSDEAYSFKIELASNGRTETFFPSNCPAKEVPVRIDYYDRRRGIVSYQLSKPARVHLQGVVARMNPRTKQAEGPVLKTIVNRAARSAGRVVEFWNGFNDEDESIYLPDHPNFKMAVSATELPAHSVIALGNRQKSFPEIALNRTGTSLFTSQPPDHQHHEGLSTLEDLSPELKVDILNGERQEDRPVWLVAVPTLEISGRLHGPSSEAFSRQPGRLWIFVDEKRILDLPPPEKTFTVDLRLKKNFSGEHILTLNWISEYGPVAVNALRFQLKTPAVSQQSSGDASRKNP